MFPGSTDFLYGVGVEPRGGGVTPRPGSQRSSGPRPSRSLDLAEILRPPDAPVISPASLVVEPRNPRPARRPQHPGNVGRVRPLEATPASRLAPRHVRTRLSPPSPSPRTTLEPSHA